LDLCRPFWAALSGQTAEEGGFVYFYPIDHELFPAVGLTFIECFFFWDLREDVIRKYCKSVINRLYW
jgi:hypothetical protein